MVFPAFFVAKGGAALVRWGANMRMLAGFNILLGVLFVGFLAYLFLKVGQPRRLYDGGSSEMLADSRVLRLLDEVAGVHVFYDRETSVPEVPDYTKLKPVMTLEEPGEVAQFLRELEKGGREIPSPPLRARGALAFVVFFKGEEAKPALLHARLAGRNACSVMPLQGAGQGDHDWQRAYSLFRFLKEKGLEEALLVPGSASPAAPDVTP